MVRSVSLSPGSKVRKNEVNARGVLIPGGVNMAPSFVL